MSRAAAVARNGSTTSRTDRTSAASDGTTSSPSWRHSDDRGKEGRRGIPASIDCSGNGFVPQKLNFVYHYWTTPPVAHLGNMSSDWGASSRSHFRVGSFSLWAAASPRLAT